MLLFLYSVLLIQIMNHKCGSCRSFFKPTIKTNGKYYKSCDKCKLKSKNERKTKHITDNDMDNDNETKTKHLTDIDDDNIQNQNTDDIITDDFIDTNNEYLNIIKLKNNIIENITNDNIKLNLTLVEKNNNIIKLNNIIIDYKITLQQFQPQQQYQQYQPPQQSQPQQQSKQLVDDRLEQMIQQMIKK